MQEYPSNSKEVRKLRPVGPNEKPPMEKVIEGKAVRRKPSLSKRFREMFFAEVDERQGIVDHVISDIMVPALKDMIMDSFQEGMQRTLFGSSRPRRSSRSGSVGVTHTNYTRYSSANRSDRPTPIRRPRSSRDFEDIILETRDDAERALGTLRETIGRYEFATVNDLYECIGETGTHTDEKWGWADLSDAVVRRLSSGGYLLDLPTPEPIES